jgi:glycosyltransferase involved in cell wall biosynthesis
MTRRYCVVIPAFDAEKTIGALVRGAKLQGFEVIVVDDGSRDQTASLASAEGALVISHLRNEGKGRALRTGFEHALRASYDGVITMDGDGQHDPTEIEPLVKAGEYQHAGIAIGNRLTNGASMPRLRWWTNWLMSAIVSALVRHRIPDSQCGFRFIRRELLSELTLRANRFDIDTELLLGAAARRWKIISVPIRSIYHNERSHIRPLRDGILFVAQLLRHLARRR